MGKYINHLSNGETLLPRGKALKLIEDGAEIVNPVFQENLICVVNNGFFEAAAYCYDEREFEAFNDPTDDRPKTWLVHPNAKYLID